MNNEIKNAIIATNKEAQYDQSAKRLLGQKIILAHILVKTVDEFKGMKPPEVVPYIVGTPYISQVPMEPGLTNTMNNSKYNKKTIPEYNENFELHRLLGTLLSNVLSVYDKFKIIKNEYDIPIEEGVRKEVTVICNLSQGIKEEAIAIGRAEGEISKLKELIQKKLNKQKTPAQIADELEEDMEVIQKLILSMQNEDF